MTGRRGWATAAIAWGVVVACGTRLPAAPPEVEYVFPAGGKQGTTLTVTAGGKADAKVTPWPAKVWIDCPGVEFTPAEANGTFNVKIAADAPPGPHLVRVYNEEAASAPRVFVVGRHAEVMESEPNDDAARPQAVESLPAFINGRLDKTGDADSYSVDVEAGRWIVAELACRRLNAPVDPVLRILDPDGNEVAFDHDTFGLDPLVAHRAERSGRYVVQLNGFTHPPAADVRFTGAKSAVYRLLVTAGPYARSAFPPGGRRGTETPLQLFGWNLGSTGHDMAWEWDATTTPGGADDASITPAGFDNTLRLGLADEPELTEAEPNDKPDAAQRVAPPAVVNGRIGRPGDVDRYSFTAAKGDRFAIGVVAASLDLPLDPVLTVEDADGKQLAREDDVGPLHDPRLDWIAPADGTYTVTVSDLSHHGGDAYVYRLQIKRPDATEFQATVEKPSVRLEAGKSADVAVKLTRQGGNVAPLGVVVSGLPEGVTATTAGASDKSGTLTVTLTAPAAQAAFNGPIRLLVTSADERQPVARAVTSDLGADQMIRRADTLWLTVTRPPAATQPAK